MTKKRKYLLGMVLVGLLSYLPMQAAGYTKTKKIQYHSLDFYFNGAKKYLNADVITVDGRSYIPVTDFCNALGLQVSTDSKYTTMYVNNGSGYSSNMSLEAELRAKEYEITSLKKEIETLKIQPTTSSSSNHSSSKYDETSGTDILGTELTATRKALESEYEDYFRNIDFDFSVNVSSSKLKVIISYDTSDEHKEFNELSSSKVKAFIEKVCADVRDRHDDIVIQGMINYTKQDKDQYEFTYSKKDVISYSIYDEISESRVESIVDDTSSLNISGYSSSIAIKSVDATVSDSNDLVTFKLYVNATDDMKSAWNSHTGTDNDTTLRSALRSIAKDVSDETDYKIEGIVYDYSTSNKIATYDYSDNELYMYSF